MAYFQTKATRVAVKVEVTEGVPVAPTTATDYLPVETDFSLTPSFDQLTNEELTGTIGKSKDTLGLENPEASLSLYLKSSGSEGVAPQQSLLLEAAFGAKSINATEYTTTASSTAGTSSVRAVVKSTGNANNFERGEALLVKDSALTNGYEIANVYTVDDANTLSTLFNFPSAPASGVGLGKASLYKPADSGHPTFSLWDYRANGGGIEMIAGCRVSELSMEVNAGEFVNMSYTVPGIAFYFNPVEITATDTKLDFTETGPTVRVATIPAGWYKDPIALADAISTAMNDVATDAITVSYSSSTGKYTISTAGSLLSLLWNTGANAANTIGDKIGFSTAADDTAALTYTSDNALTLTSPQTPSFYDVNPFVAKNNKVQLGSFSDYTCFSAQTLSFTLSDEITPVLSICSASGKEASVITAREATVEVLANFQQYEVDKFKRFRSGENTQFAFSFGEKTGSNWTPGKCGNLAMFNSTITNWELTDTDGLVTLNMTLSAYVTSGLGEVYLNLL